MAKKTIKITIKLPTGVSATSELVAKATEAAEAAVAEAGFEYAEAEALANELYNKQGIQITAEEILARKTPVKTKKAKRATKKAARRTRVVLDDAQRDALISELAEGIKVAEAAEKYGVSTATIMNIKTKAGLTKKRS